MKTSSSTEHTTAFLLRPTMHKCSSHNLQFDKRYIKRTFQYVLINHHGKNVYQLIKFVYEDFWAGLTWISDGNESRAPEITVPVVSSLGLIVEIHGYRGMVYQVVGGVTGTTSL